VAKQIENKIREIFKIPNDKTIVIPVLFDEYQKLQNNDVKYGVKLGVEILSFLRKTEQKGLVFIPVMAGTTEYNSVKNIDLNEFGFRQIGLGPLEEGEDMEIVTAKLSKQITDNEWCKVAVESLGRIPRYIEFFLTACVTKTTYDDRREFFDQALTEVCLV
jgi:hypothetical protein